MGGRGAKSGRRTGYIPAAVLAELPYTVTSFDDKSGGAVYPFLEQTHRAWRILTRPVSEQDEPHPAHTFGLEEPTLRWVNGSQVNDLYVDGMTTDQFLTATGLELNLHKGGFVLSKRLSRVMRPHFVSGFFQPEEVQVGYLEQTPEEAKVWDGAGLISRRMLQKLLLSDDLTPAKRERLEIELRHARRVEFTIMTDRGQDKGHAIVADDLRDGQGNRVDFLLPQDTKKEVKLTNGQTFVGLSFVHGHNDMRLDIQSLINLYPFFTEEQLLGWLKDEGALFTQSVETGKVAEVMARIDRHTALDEVQSWPLREYLASGGQPMWFGSHVKSLMNQHLKRLNESTLGKMRLPIPGGRHYVMPVAVGKRAGVKGLDVPRGHIKIDPQYGTAWVNDEDWLALPDSPQGVGIAGILGGADNDDALWLHPFTDKGGEQKVLAWRSPNQVGEYVILKPTPDSHTLPWARVEGEPLTYSQADSHQLPPRVDFTATDYLGLVDQATAGGLGEGAAYSVYVMAAAMERALANQGALGMYCNSLMLNKALFGRLPDTPPAPLEEIIDSAVKTGADLSPVVLWNYANSWDILAKKTPIPAILHERLSVDRQDKENRPPLPRLSQVHWLDTLEQGVKTHIQAIREKRDELVQQTQPPPALFENVTEEDVRLGAGLNQAFAAALNIHKKKTKRQPPEANNQPLTAIDHARQATEDYLAHFPPSRWGAILRGALVSVYQSEERGSDAAAWLGGERDEAGHKRAGIAGRTVAALREVGLLAEIIPTKEGLVAYWDDPTMNENAPDPPPHLV